jgi:hypothetical protein
MKTVVGGVVRLQCSSDLVQRRLNCFLLAIRKYRINCVVHLQQYVIESMKLTARSNVETAFDASASVAADDDIFSTRQSYSSTASASKRDEFMLYSIAAFNVQVYFASSFVSLQSDEIQTHLSSSCHSRSAAATTIGTLSLASLGSSTHCLSLRFGGREATTAVKVLRSSSPCAPSSSAGAPGGWAWWEKT